MKATPHRVTVQLQAELHTALKLKSIVTGNSVSQLINEALRGSLLEDTRDLAAFQMRSKEPSLNFEQSAREASRRHN